MPLVRTIAVIEDVALNDSDKTLTVPAGTRWALMSCHVRLVSTAVAGNRQLAILITDASDNTLLRYVSGGTQAASITMDYNFAPGHPNETGAASNNGNQLRALAEGLKLPPGYKVRVFDSAAIDAAADDLTVRLLVERGSG